MESIPAHDDVGDLAVHGEHLRRLARGLLYGRSGAEDVVQQVWLNALRHGPRPGWSLKAWLSGAVRNQARQDVREESRRTRRERVAARPEAVPSAADSAERLELLQRVLAAVQALEEPYRGVVVARFLDDLPPREVARRRGVPVETVRTQTRRGLERLRHQLDPDGPDDRAAFLAVLAPLAGARPWNLPLPLEQAIEPIAGVLMGLQTKTLVGTALVAAAASLAGWRWANAPTPQRVDASGSAIAETPEEPAPTPVAAHVPPAAVAPATASPEASRRAAAAGSAPGWAFVGQTLDRARMPLADVRLVARLFEGFDSDGTLLAETELVSDADGAFAWALHPPTGTVTLHLAARHPEHLARDLDVTVRRGAAPEPIDLLLRPLDLEVVGTVRDLTGRPIAGAHVRWTEECTATSDVRGDFRLRATSGHSTLYLVAWADGFAEQPQTLTTDGPGELLGADFVLRPARVVSGRVVDERGAAVAGAEVRAFGTRRTSMSDGLGRFRLAHVDPEADVIVQASKSGLVSGRVDLQPGNDVEVDLVLKRGALVAGRVLDDEGEPVGGALVFAGGRSAWDADAVRAHTGDDGSFRLEGVAAGRTLLGASHEGLAQHEEQIEVPGAGGWLGDLVVRLDRGHVLAGQVVDAQGAPVADAYVSARRNGEYLELRTRSDAAGRFRLQGLPREGLQLEVFGRGFQRLVQAPERLDVEDLVLELRRAGGLAGRVVDGATGRPIEDFRIRIVTPERRPDDPRSSGGVEVSWVREGRSFHDPEGRWAMDDEELTPGDVFAIEASAEGYAPAVEPRVLAEVEPDPDAHVLRLVPGAELRGRVVAAHSGAPIVGAVVSRAPESDVGEPWPMSNMPTRYRTTTDTDGWFVLEHVPTAAMRLRVEHPDWLDLLGEVFEPPPSGSPPAFFLELEAGASVAGRLLDGGGVPLPGERVDLVALEPDATADQATQTTRSDAEGRFTFEHLRPGPWVLRHVQQDGPFSLTRLSLGVVVGRDGLRDVELRPTGSARLEGHLACEDELPERALVELSLDHAGSDVEDVLRREGGRRRATSDTDGRFVFEGLAPGRYWVSVHAYDGLTQTDWNGHARMTLVEGESAVLEVPLDRR